MKESLKPAGPSSFVKMQNTKTSIIVPTRTVDVRLETMFGSLRKQTRIADEILVIGENGNSQESGSYTNKEIKILRQSTSGPANARNFGAQNANGEILVFLDSDCLPCNEGWLSVLLSESQRTNADILCGRVLIKGASLVSRFVRAMNGLGTPDYGKNDINVEDQFVSFPATNLAVRKSVFTQIGGFDEKLTIAEDMDFLLRAWRQGKMIRYVPGAVVFHKHRDTLKGLLEHAFRTGKGSVNFLKKYGFFNRFLRGTFLSAVAVPLLMVLLAAILVNPVLVVVPAVSYLALSAFMYNRCEKKRDSPAFPLLLLIYSVGLGVGVWRGLVR